MGSLYHLSVGCADASIILSGGCYLVDCHNIQDYRHLLPGSKRLAGVIITHQHYDHYSGLQFLRENGYSISYLIHSPYERRYGDNSVTSEEWNEFNNHREYFAQRGTKTYAPFRQESWDKPYWDSDGLQFWILGPLESTAQSDTRELHDACLVVKVHMSARMCLFTGDASDKNVQDVATVSHICDDILRASHHGSLDGADLDFVKKCNAQYTVISTESGVHENVPHPVALRRYQENTKGKAYRTDQDGTIRWDF